MNTGEAAVTPAAQTAQTPSAARGDEKGCTADGLKQKKKPQTMLGGTHHGDHRIADADETDCKAKSHAPVKQQLPISSIPFSENDDNDETTPVIAFLEENEEDGDLPILEKRANGIHDWENVDEMMEQFNDLVVPNQTKSAAAFNKLQEHPSPQRKAMIIQNNEIQEENSKIITEREISEYDVLCGRGGRSNSTPGNQAYTSNVKAHAMKYHRKSSRNTRSKKLEVIMEIRDEVHANGGRFLMRNNDDDLYHELPPNQVIKKIQQCFRTIKSQAARKKNEELQQQQRKRKMKRPPPRAAMIVDDGGDMDGK